MKLIYSILICMLMASCSATSHLRCVKCKFKGDSIFVVKGKAPSQWNENILIAPGNNPDISQYLYIYADSSIFYVADNYNDPSSPNESHIEQLNTKESKLRTQNHRFIAESNKQYIKEGYLSLVVPQAPYNMVFSGKDEHGLYWKDIKYGKISIGYIGVSEDNKLLFDNAVDLFRVSIK